MKKKFKVPITFFEKIEESEDSRFTNVKIWLMHIGENLNKSYFSKKAVEEAIPTLANTPILGYIETNKDGEEDFTNHRMIVVKNADGVEIKYIGQAYGMIPETNNAKFEKRVGTDGVEREYLTVEGALWNKWDEPIDIFEKNNSKGQSMELHNDAVGHFDKDTKLFHFDKFKFFGACVLGDDVKPAMMGSSIEVQFSEQNDFEEYIQQQMEEFKLVYSEYQLSIKDNEYKNKNKEDEEMKDKLLKIALKFSLTQEQLTEKGIDLEKFSSEEEFEAKLQEVTSTNFSLTSEQLNLEFRNQLRTKFTEKDDYGYKYKSYDYYYVDHQDGEVFAQSNVDGNRIVGFKYSFKGDVPVVDFESKKVKKIVYSDIDNGDTVQPMFSVQESVDLQLELKGKEVEKQFSETIKEKDLQIESVNNQFESTKTEFESTKTELQEVQTKFETLVNEIEPLRQFKANSDKDAHEVIMTELFTKFSQLEEEEVSDLKEKMFELTVEDAEKELTYRLGKKVAEGKFTFSAKRDDEDRSKNSIKIKLDGAEFELNPTEMQKSYAHLFTEYGDK